MSGVRLSTRQREVLEIVEVSCRPSARGLDEHENIIPLYIDHLPNILFNTERERERFIENLQSRGLVLIEKRFFIYITEAGRAALARVTGAHS